MTERGITVTTRLEHADAALNELLAAVKTSVGLLHQVASQQKISTGDAQVRLGLEYARYLVEHAPALIAELRQIPEARSKQTRGTGPSD
jgi:hypothetical protein